MAETNAWVLPTKEESKAGDFAPIRSDNYIAKLAKIVLDYYPRWIQATRSWDYVNKELKYKVYALVYKPTAEDGIVDTTGKAVPALVKYVEREINPFSLGFDKGGKPSMMRGLIAYSTGVEPEIDDIVLPGVLILDPQNKKATDADADQYKKEFLAIAEKTITPDQFTMRAKGFKHIPDVRSLEGKYVGVTLTVTDDQKYNKCVGFSRVPKGFVPDVAVETAAMPKFLENFKKGEERRKQRETQAVAVPPTTASTMPSDDLPF